MIVVEKMVNYRIIALTTVVEWTLDSERGGFGDVHRSYLWTMLKSVLTKINGRVQRATRKLEVAKVASSSSTKSNQPNDPMNSEDAAEGTLEMNVDGQSQSEESSQELDRLKRELDELQREKKQVFILVFGTLLDRLLNAMNEESSVDQQSTAWFSYGEGLLCELGRYVSRTIIYIYIYIYLYI
jgi:hypothetical protein